MPQSFAEVVALFDKRREAVIRSHLCVAHVIWSHFEPGRIEFRPTAGRAEQSRQPPRPAARRMDREPLACRRLRAAEGEPTLREQEERRERDLRNEVEAIRWFRRCSRPFRERRSLRFGSVTRRRSRSGGLRADRLGGRSEHGRGRSMKNIGQLMKQAQEMQEKMAEMQAQLEAVEMTGVAGGGMVRLTLNGKGDLKKIKIDKALLDPEEVEVLEDLIVAAFNDARRRFPPMPNRRCKS